ncbi:MAG TPA: hypothetical protein VFX03_08375, partial [Thermomicrobiales bacterium]|nr:hypothetical protein [Thermomicrobiales bacterium]
DDVLSGLVVAPDAVYDASLRAAGRGEQPAFAIWTPAGEHRFGAGELSLSLEMKEDAFHRLLLRRLDLQAAIGEQRVTLRAGDRNRVRRVAEILSPTPWVYQHLDYI